MQKLLAFCCLMILATASIATAQETDKSKRPSPPAHADFTFSDGATIHIDYSSPRMKGRKIFGGLVPYGQVWRAGANEATTFVTSAPVMVGNKKVPAGSYTLFAVPDKGKWSLVISKKTGEWGTPYPGEDNDFARTDMVITHLPEPMENFTITLEKTAGGCALNMAWEQTQASVDITDKK